MAHLFALRSSSAREWSCPICAYCSANLSSRWLAFIYSQSSSISFLCRLALQSASSDHPSSALSSDPPFDRSALFCPLDAQAPVVQASVSLVSPRPPPSLLLSIPPPPPFVQMLCSSALHLSAVLHLAAVRLHPTRFHGRLSTSDIQALRQGFTKSVQDAPRTAFSQYCTLSLFLNFAPALPSTLDC